MVWERLLRGVSPQDRAAIRAEVRRMARRMVRLGPRKVAAVGCGVLVVVVTGLVIGRWWALGVAVAGLLGAVGVTVVLELRRARGRLARFLRRSATRGGPSAIGFAGRSPRVGRLVERAAHGHMTRALGGLSALVATGSAGEQRDACLAMADLAVRAGRGEEARSHLGRLDPGPQVREAWHREYWALNIEAAVLRGEAAMLEVPPAVRVALGEDAHLRYLLANTGPVADRVAVISAALQAHGCAPLRAGATHLAELAVERRVDESAVAPAARVGELPLVSVIVPAFNGADTVHIALDSLCAQSWPALEIIVVDDCSTDTTTAVVRAAAAADGRIRLVARTQNGGAYRARNTGLDVATGAFITVNDADDWAHADKIALQARHLIDHPELVGTMTSMVRATEDLHLLRRGTPVGDVVGLNYSSLMVRREALAAVGPWDEVVVEGDSEMLGRVRARFGRPAVAHIHQDLPLSVTLRSAGSLTQSSVTGLASHRHAMGARRIYGDAYRAWHASDGFAACIPLVRSDDRHPFPAPPLVRRRGDAVHEFDMVLWSDLGLPGGTTASNLTEIAANESHGLRTGLVHNRNPRWADEGVNPKFRAAHSPLTRLVTLGEQITCDVLAIKYPPSALEIPDTIPELTVRGEILMIINQTPMSGYTGSDQREVYSIGAVDAEVRARWGRAPLWVPVGPAVREVLHAHHAAEVATIRLADTDWVELIDADRWRRPQRPAWAGPGSRPIRIGRHGRDSQWKWPADRAGILQVYPDDPAFEVHVLGGADVARERLGRLPANWKVLGFDAMPPAQWLADLDVFVSFPHPDMIEAFGRTLLEALAVGVPVVTDTRFAGLFGEAVIACEPSAALDQVRALMADGDLYDTMVRRGHDLVDAQYGFGAQLTRLRAMGLTR